MNKLLLRCAIREILILEGGNRSFKDTRATSHISLIDQLSSFFGSATSISGLATWAGAGKAGTAITKIKNAGTDSVKKLLTVAGGTAKLVGKNKGKLAATSGIVALLSYFIKGNISDNVTQEDIDSANQSITDIQKKLLESFNITTKLNSNSDVDTDTRTYFDTVTKEFIDNNNDYNSLLTNFFKTFSAANLDLNKPAIKKHVYNTAIITAFLGITEDFELKTNAAAIGDSEALKAYALTKLDSMSEDTAVVNAIAYSTSLPN